MVTEEAQGQRGKQDEVEEGAGASWAPRLGDLTQPHN